MYKLITCADDYGKLQTDINSIYNCISARSLTLNPEKCKYLVCSKKSSPEHRHNDTVSCFKYRLYHEKEGNAGFKSPRKTIDCIDDQSAKREGVYFGFQGDLNPVLPDCFRGISAVWTTAVSSTPASSTNKHSYYDAVTPTYHIREF